MAILLLAKAGAKTGLREAWNALINCDTNFSRLNFGIGMVSIAAYTTTAIQARAGDTNCLHVDSSEIHLVITELFLRFHTMQIVQCALLNLKRLSVLDNIGVYMAIYSVKTYRPLVKSMNIHDTVTH